MSFISDLGDVARERVSGVVVGIVTKTDGDPLQLGRIRVRFPWLGGMIESGWARMASFAAGPNRGAYFLPEEGDEVLLAFDHGDINVPYVVGALWNGRDVPPVAAEAQQNVRAIRSKSGSVITLDDTDGEEKVSIADKNGNEIVLDVAANTITIRSKQDIALSAPSGTVKIEARDVQINATATAKVSAGTELTITAEGTGSIQAAELRLN